MPLEPAGFHHVPIDLATTPAEPILFAPDALAGAQSPQFQCVAVEHSPPDLTVLNSTFRI